MHGILILNNLDFTEIMATWLAIMALLKTKLHPIIPKKTTSLNLREILREIDLLQAVHKKEPKLKVWHLQMEITMGKTMQESEEVNYLYKI